MLPRLPNELPNTRSHDSQDQGVQRNDEHEEERVIVLAHARPQPNAVVIEFAHAVVTEVAMGRLGGSEDQASFTEFHGGERCVAEVGSVGRLSLVDEVEDALALMIDVNILWVNFVPSFFGYECSWYDARIDTTCVEH